MSVLFLINSGLLSPVYFLSTGSAVIGVPNSAASLKSRGLVLVTDVSVNAPLGSTKREEVSTGAAVTLLPVSAESK